MKYELSQGQYRDFLNTLTYTQQVSLTNVAPTSTAGIGALTNTNANRNGLDIQTPGNATTLLPAVYGCNLNANTTYNEAADGEWIACNFLRSTHSAAYLQWSGLRPITDLEFEKACRGSQTPVMDEFAWGNAIVTTVNSINDAGLTSETGDLNANAAMGNLTGGPLRVGSFARSSTNRVQSGASYYGIMEMSGNLHERCVSIGRLPGRTFIGTHGNGVLSNAGWANAATWPGIDGNGEVTVGEGFGFRGGVWSDALGNSGKISDRVFGSLAGASHDAHRGPFRGVRTAQ
jgi:formylglycine-generating enzyme required for sulfatase activity